MRSPPWVGHKLDILVIACLQASASATAWPLARSCNRLGIGSLSRQFIKSAVAPAQRALERGEFRLLGPRQENPPDMKRVCSVALDIASGMAALHKHNVVHGGQPLKTSP